MDVVFFDIGLNGVSMGRVLIRLYRDTFPDAVENFIRIAEGKTFRSEEKCGYIKQTRRSYCDNKIHKIIHNKYLVGGDIYNNDGTDAGTIFNDEPIPEIVPDYYIPHDQSGLLSVVPHLVESEALYDSTFMITLGPMIELNETQIVIGSVYQGMDILDRINASVLPRAGRRYPIFSIILSGIHTSTRDKRNLIPRLRFARKMICDPEERLSASVPSTDWRRALADEQPVLRLRDPIRDIHIEPVDSDERVTVFEESYQPGLGTVREGRDNIPIYATYRTTLLPRYGSS